MVPYLRITTGTKRQLGQKWYPKERWKPPKLYRAAYTYLLNKHHLLYTYQDLRAKKHQDKNSLFVLEKPDDWSYDFFHNEKQRIDTLIGYIIFTSEQNRVAHSPLLMTDK